MNFKIRFGTMFIGQIIMISCWSVVGLMDVISPIFKDGFRHYTYILTFLIVVLNLFQCYRHIYAAVFNKNVLSVNENYIYDFIGDVKYYWEDIHEIEEKSGFLTIKLYNPVDYLDKFRNPFKRFTVKLWFKPDEKRSSFLIDIGSVAADPVELLEILNDYSIKAEQ